MESEIKSPASSNPEDPETYNSEEIDKAKFSEIIQQPRLQYADSENVNWGEIEDIYGLYELADNASKHTGGIPDYILKEAMDLVLTLHRKTLDPGWERNHIEKLQKAWKLEMDKEKPTKRPTMVPMEARQIHPYTLKKQRRRKLPKAVAQSMMGVSSMLAIARSVMKLDNGDHEVAETADGNIELDGEPLTFESWGKIAGTDDAVISYENQHEFDNKVKPTPNILKVEPAPTKSKRPHHKRNGVQAEKNDETSPKRKRRVSEEGEISADSNSSSSSSEDDSDVDVPKESRRAATRKQKRQNIKNNQFDLKAKMHEIYDLRYELVSQLTVSHKVELLNSLKMVHGEHDNVMKSQVEIAKFLAQA